MKVLGVEAKNSGVSSPEKDDEEEEATKKGHQHLETIQVLAKKNAEMKREFLREYTYYKKAGEDKTAWFVAMVHFRAKIIPKDSGNKLWDATRGFREKVLHTMQVPKFEVFVLCMVFTDVLMVIIEVLIDSMFEFPSHHGDEHGDGHGDHHEDGHEDGHGKNGTDHHGEHDAATHAPEHDEGHQRRLRMVMRSAARGVVRRWAQDGKRLLSGADGAGSCDIDMAMDIANGCRTISIAILFVFAAEMLCKFCCAPGPFCKHIGHVLDVFVVGGSIVFEFTLHHSYGGLLIFFRCWRGVRIMHGFYEQVEYICKALETDAHLEKALGTVEKYKVYTSVRHLRSDWKYFKKAGSAGLQTSPTKVFVVTEEGVDQETQTSPTFPQSPWKNQQNGYAHSPDTAEVTTQFTTPIKGNEHERDGRHLVAL